ncbi:aspartate aminotransferase [Hydrogenimonas sp.]|nr:aspartate aminotransferase [Hydrogenimonas sp.]
MGEDMSGFDTPVDRSGTCSVKYEERLAKFGDAEVLPLWVADMDLPSPGCVTKALEKRAKHPLYGYTIYPERFFAAISGWMEERHGWSVERDSIVPVPGVVPALNLLVRALTKKGEGILIQPPVYHPFFRLGRNHGRRLLENPLVLKDGRYEIDFDDFRRRANEAKLFILCSPHNPAGRVWSEEELEKIGRICIEEEVVIISDEVHADIVYRPHTHTPVAKISKEISDITITLNAPSKTFNIAGLNTAYAIVQNDSLRRRLEAELKRFDLTMGNVFGIEALTAAYEGGAEWLEELLSYLEKNIGFVRRFLEEKIPSIEAIETEATYLMWLDCRKLGMGDDELERFFIHGAKLGLNSGVSFGEGGSGFMRLNVACPKAVLEEAMERLESAFHP